VSISGATPDSAYLIGSLDVLDISVFRVPELTKTVQVDESGTVNLPFIGEILAAGRTAKQLEHDLTARLAIQYVKNPQVTVYVKEYRSQHVTVTGAIKTPGVYPISGKTSLMDVVASAGGLNDISDSTVLVLRERDGKRSAAKFDVSAIQKGTADDPALQSGDDVIAGTSAIKQAFNTILKASPIADTAEQASQAVAPTAR
jgi:polysaccharide export outer membrane protein